MLSVTELLCDAAKKFRVYGYQDFVFLMNNIIRTLLYHMGAIRWDYSNMKELLKRAPIEYLGPTDKSELLGFFYNISFFSNYPELKDKEQSPAYIYHQLQTCRLDNLKKNLVVQYQNILAESKEKVKYKEQDYSTFTRTIKNTTFGANVTIESDTVPVSMDEKVTVEVVSDSQRRKIEQETGYGENLYIVIQDVKPFELFSPAERLFDP